MVILEYSVEKPLNREPCVKELVSSFYTEKDGYDRNHGPIPHIDPKRHEVIVDGECAGNRRHTMRTLLKEVDGIDWGDGAVMNCRWRGPRLRDVLNGAGVKVADPSKAHVAFACHATETQHEDWYGASIPLERGMLPEGDVVLALEMNGETLPINHGYPVRVIAPGIAGARSVKWLDRVTVQLEESSSFYQQRDYKVLPPEATDREKAELFWPLVPAVQDMPVNSVIAEPACGQTVVLAADGTAEVRGYALPQGCDGPVRRVEVSADGGQSWADAAIADGIDGRRRRWCWVLWTARVALGRGQPGRILSRATDTGGNVQCACPTWNLRGVAYNGYGEARDLTIE